MKKLSLFITAWLYAGMAYAQDLIPCADGTYADPTIGCVAAPTSVIRSESNIAELILKIASGFMVFVMGVAVIGIIYGGITYAMAMGVEEKLQKAKRAILWSVVGLVIALLARLVAEFILKTVV